MSTAGGIDIIVPVLDRQQNAQKVADSIRDNTTVAHTITFVCSPGDDEEIAACVATGANVSVVNWEPGPADGAKKWNHGYRISAAISNHPLVMLAADDLEFTPKWDVMALSMADQTGAGVIGTDDDANPLVKRGRHSTHSPVLPCLSLSAAFSFGVPHARLAIRLSQGLPLRCLPWCPGGHGPTNASSTKR